MPQTPLFTGVDLTTWLQRPVSDEAGIMVERVVWGWLRPLLNVDERPDPPSDELFSWAIELGGIAFANPEGLASYSLEAESSSYSSERRDEILREVANGGVTPVGASLPPKSSFPPAQEYPDPARRYGAFTSRA